VAISLATLPAVAVAALVQVLQDSPDHVVVLVTAVLVAACAYVTGRLLTARVVADDTGVVVRGLAVDMRVPYAALSGVAIAPAPRVVQLLLWGLLEPYAVVVKVRDGRSLSPVALWAGADDADVERLVTTIRLRLDPPAVPRQRAAVSASTASST
jgi:hypothetical protein